MSHLHNHHVSHHRCITTNTREFSSSSSSCINSSDCVSAQCHFLPFSFVKLMCYIMFSVISIATKFVHQIAFQINNNCKPSLLPPFSLPRRQNSNRQSTSPPAYQWSITTIITVDMVLYGAICLIVAICFANSLHGDFVHDDIPALVQNPDVLGTTTLSELFLHDFWGRPMSDPESHKSYRPVTTLTFR